MKADTSKVKPSAKARPTAAKAVTPKPAAKVTASKVAASKPVAKAAASKPVPKVAAPKPAAKAVAPKPLAKATTAKPVAKTPAKTPAKAKAKAKAAVRAAPVAPAAPIMSSGVLRSARPSSRLTQLTVPSMAQSVASTAAKSSFSTPAPSQAQIAVPTAAPKKDAKLANNWKTKSVEQLSDAEVMAMPDAEYMNDKQVAYFRHMLVQLKQDIHNSAGKTTETLREDTSVVPDPADRATIEEEHALELRTRDRERKLLKKIEQSINRIDAGDYGYCDETGEPIGVGRLLARPTATLSLEAQQRRELKQKMFGD